MHHGKNTASAKFCVSRCNIVNSFRGNTVQRKVAGARKRTSSRARTRDLHSFTELQPHELSIPAANLSSPISLCTSRKCAAIQRPLEDPRLEVGTVSSDGSGLSGRQRVA